MAARRHRVGAPRGVRPNSGEPHTPSLTTGPRYFIPETLDEDEEEEEPQQPQQQQQPASGSGLKPRERAESKANDNKGSEQVPEDKPTEAVKPKPLQNPIQPMKCEIIEHNLTHLPYRSWCPDCINGRGKTLPHEAQDPDDMHLIPTVSVDYHFMGSKEDEERSQPILATKDHGTRKVFAQVAPSKGTSHSYPV